VILGEGAFIVNFYNNNDVKISSEKDDKVEFSFLIPSALETLDMEFNKALTEYRTYGPNGSITVTRCKVDGNKI